MLQHQYSTKRSGGVCLRTSEVACAYGARLDLLLKFGVSGVVRNPLKLLTVLVVFQLLVCKYRTEYNL